ncbi:MAG TPA: hypothetical protein VMJ64_08335 [Anaerolineales bacterium]|nr:hypothetical protein [Anaerolineales bacterium]
MKILALEHDLSSQSIEHAAELKEEARCVWQLYQSGIIREVYFRGDRAEAVLMLECKDPGEARRILDTLPLVRSGLIDFEIIPLAPYPGFGRLFSQ